MSLASAVGLEASRAANPSPITYTRGDVCCELVALQGQSMLPAFVDGVEVVHQTVDFLFPVNELLLNASGDEALPKEDDRITRTYRGKPSTFRVLKIDRALQFRFSDPERTWLRIHTKEVAE